MEGSTGGAGCCCNDCAPGELVEDPTRAKDSAELLEDAFAAQKAAKMGGKILAGAQNAAGVVLDALQDDVSEETPVDQGRSKTGDAAGGAWVQLQSYMHHSHITVKMVGVFIATGLIVVSILDIVGFAKTNVDSEPFNVRAFGYLHNAWNILFGVLMIFMDAPARWLGKMAPWQSTLWQKAHILAKARGRALVHFYVGIINLAMADFLNFTLWTIIHLAVGGSLVVCAIIMLLNHHTYHCQRHSHVKRTYAGTAKVTEALDVFKEEALEVRTYIAKNHFSVRIVSFLIAIALVATSVLGMINVFGLLFSPFHYVIGVFDLFFAVVIALVDGEASWFEKCCNCRVKLFQAFPCLAELPGRSLLHFYVGSINMVMLPGMPLDIVYVALGGTLCLCSMLMLCHHNYCLKVPDPDRKSVV